MKISFFPRLAWNGIRKNRKLYLPYLLTCIGMVMMYYIICFLTHSGILKGLPGAAVLVTMMQLGSEVISIFTALFLLYSNAFLVRRRQKEFGLYNILGMGKGAISLVLLWETLITAVISLVSGLLAGMLFSKAAEALMVNMLQGQVSYTLTVSVPAIVQTVVLFAIIFACIFLRSLWILRKTNAINLLHSENVGEKPPRANWLLGLGGVVLLAVAYYMAVSIHNPMAALAVFFGAVALVIVATYLLFCSGSVLLCRVLQRNRRYYYKASHFVSVSSMAYRMKRTGAGLASVCVLLTMVLVMISSTVCLYLGEEDVLNIRYPRQINIDLDDGGSEKTLAQRSAEIRRAVEDTLSGQGIEASHVLDYSSAVISGLLTGDTVEEDSSRVEMNSLDDFEKIRLFCFVPLADYNALTGQNETLAPGEALLYAMRVPYEKDTITFLNATTFAIKRHLDTFDVSGFSAMDVVDSIYLVVPDLEKTLEPLAAFNLSSGRPMLQKQWSYGFDPLLDSGETVELYQQLKQALKAFPGAGVECRETNRVDFYSLYGGLFFLGLLLSVVFLFAAVLIIYYRQLSEGYEDQSRFGIMQKVGMTKREIRKSINSQMLTVFLMPLLMAGLHMAFAFPMVRMLLLAFNMNNVRLFASTTLVSFLLFGVFYGIVYKITSNAYYDIVSGAREKES